MPKNITATKSKMRFKSTRKPLQDVSNRKHSVESGNVLKKPYEEVRGQTGGDSLDRLLLVHSDLSSLLHQIEKLVVQAVQLTPSDKGRKEINQFADVLYDMHASLKLWVPKFQKTISSQSILPEEKPEHSIMKTEVSVQKERTCSAIESPEQTKFESLVSPSPLVSWRAECNTEGGRQLFLLTPLPQTKSFASKLKAPYGIEKATSKEIANQVPHFNSVENLELDEAGEGGVTEKSLASKVLDLELDKAGDGFGTSCSSPENYSKRYCPVFVMTPCLKMSPPKSCILLEPVSEFSRKKNLGERKCTPFPVRVQDSRSCDKYLASESWGKHSCDDLKIKYPELCGINVNNLRNRMVTEKSPDWNFSPPKTCAIMEPVDDKVLANAAAGSLSSMTKDISSVTLDFIGTTPMVKEAASSFRMGKHPGENTLKKELWMKFEAASTRGIPINRPVPHNTTKKGFLDLLEEESDP